MRSSSGSYFSRLDHVRALAAFLVFFWHCTHKALPVTTVGSPGFSWLEEGWTGVSLFMTLSGYLFARIIDDKQVRYGAFLWNRFVRLAPLLGAFFVVQVFYVRFDWLSFVSGFYTWTWPLGAWSLTVEMHFYLVFPLLLLLQRRAGTLSLLALLGVAILFRAFLWSQAGSIQELAYLSLVGRFDEFLLGMVFFRASRSALVQHHGGAVALGSLSALAAFFHWFNASGGFYGLAGPYPSPSPIWVVMSTIQGLAYGAFIAGYEHAAMRVPAVLDRVLARAGEVSYSTYLWHLTLLSLFPAALFPAGIWTASVLAAALFVPMTLVAMVSFEIFERPFLRFRVKYLGEPAASSGRTVASRVREPAGG